MNPERTDDDQDELGDLGAPLSASALVASANLPWRAVMFVDLSGSTRLYEQLGDRRAKALVTETLGALAQVVVQHRGRVVKTIGDELLCVFDNGHEAMAAAHEMLQQSTRARDPAEKTFPDLMRLRIGINFGPVIEEGGDIFGDTVNTAARVVALARPDTILVSETLRDALPLALRALLKFRDTAVLRGKARTLDVYEVAGGMVDSDETQNLARVLDHTIDLGLLSLGSERLGIAIEIARARPGLTVGRGTDNDLVVPHSFASRQHARIDYKHGKFYVTDFSHNGTCIELADGTRTLIRKSDCRLTGEGTLYFGEEPGPDALFGLSFSVFPRG